MPRPRSERQSLEEEFPELRGQLAGYRRQLALTPAEDKTRWEFLEGQIQRAQRRLATIEARLAAIRTESP
jgi:chromosome segregation ATPase